MCLKQNLCAQAVYLRDITGNIKSVLGRIIKLFTTADDVIWEVITTEPA